MSIKNRNYTGVFLLCLSILLLFSGCGYKLRADGKPVGTDITSLAIPLVGSTSSERGFEADFTSVLRNEFLSRGRVPLRDKKDAEMILKGYVSEINTQPLTHNSVRQTVSGRVVTHETTSSERLMLRLDISLIERKTGRVLWHERSLVEEEKYTVSSDPLATGNNRRRAMLEIARLLSERVYNMTMERF